MKIKFFKNKFGTALLEVLIVLNIVSIAGVSSSSMGILTMQNMALAEDFVIVQNMAVEAVEIVKNIRDTNWLRYPDNKDICWLNTEPSTGCDENSTRASGSYVLEKSGDISNENKNVMWKLKEKHSSQQKENILNNPNYNYKFENPNLSGDPINSKFYREIFIDDIDTTNPDNKTEKIKIIIVWKQGERLNIFQTVTTLTNTRK